MFSIEIFNQVSIKPTAEGMLFFAIKPCTLGMAALSRFAGFSNGFVLFSTNVDTQLSAMLSVLGSARNDRVVSNRQDRIHCDFVIPTVVEGSAKINIRDRGTLLKPLRGVKRSHVVWA